MGLAARLRRRYLCALLDGRRGPGRLTRPAGWDGGDGGTETSTSIEIAGYRLRVCSNQSRLDEDVGTGRSFIEEYAAATAALREAGVEWVQLVEADPTVARHALALAAADDGVRHLLIHAAERG